MQPTPARDAASIERRKVGMVLPPPVLFLLCALAAALVHKVWLGGFHPTLATMIGGALLIKLGLLILASCVWRFRAEELPIRPVSPPALVMRKGLYAYSRNPMYLGMAIVLAGIGLWLGSAVYALAVPAFLAAVHFGVVLGEERYLEQLHGDQYRDYKLRVPRWV